MGDVDNELTGKIIGAAIEVHRVLGPGLLESAYEAALAHEFTLQGVRFQRQLSLPVEYKGTTLDLCYRIDFLVEDQVIVEVKAVEKLIGVHEAQLLTYLRLMNKRIGLLMNFHSPVLKSGIQRIIL